MARCMITTSHMIISLAVSLCGKLVFGIPHYIIQVLSSGTVIHMFMQVSTLHTIMNWKHEWSQGCVLVFAVNNCPNNKQVSASI